LKGEVTENVGNQCRQHVGAHKPLGVADWITPSTPLPAMVPMWMFPGALGAETAFGPEHLRNGIRRVAADGGGLTPEAGADGFQRQGRQAAVVRAC